MLALYLGRRLRVADLVCVLFVGVLLRNLLTLLNWHEVSDREVSCSATSACRSSSPWR